MGHCEHTVGPGWQRGWHGAGYSRAVAELVGVMHPGKDSSSEDERGKTKAYELGLDADGCEDDYVVGCVTDG